MVSQKIKNIVKFFIRNEDPEKLSKISGLISYIGKRLKTLFIIKVEGIKKLQHRYSDFHNESWVILHYQRIIDPKEIPLPISTSSYVTPKTFVMHCRELSKNSKVISLEKLCSILDKGMEPEPGTVVITFDGGFNDFLMHASKPLLENKLHATIALKTGYIGSKAFLLNDQIATSIMLFASQRARMKPFDNVDPAINSSIEKTFHDGIPTTKTIQTCISILIACDIKTRLAILTSIGQQLTELEMDIPAWQDFMKWQDVSYLQELGFSFITNLHSEISLPTVNSEILSRELLESQKLFEIHGIKYMPVVSLPYGLFTPQNIIDLTNEKITYCLGNHLSPGFHDQTEQTTKILKRVTICEGNSLSKDLFFNQIWDIS